MSEVGQVNLFQGAQSTTDELPVTGYQCDS